MNNNIWVRSAFEKRDYNTAARERMAESGAAMPDGSFPISNRTDLMNAIRSIGRALAAKQHIKRRARALGLTDMLPEGWK
jgi:chorismate-pyruvate lyase